MGQVSLDSGKAGVEAAEEVSGPWRDALRGILHHKMAVAGLIILVFFYRRRDIRASAYSL